MFKVFIVRRYAGQGNAGKSILVMKKIDFRSVDGQLLLTFLSVLEDCSVTNSADRLGVTQSTVSHSLARLRSFFNDPLFVRSGNSLVPTERALSLKKPVRTALDSLESLTHQLEFDPREQPLSFVVAANDMQRDIIFPQLVREMHEQGVALSLEIIPSGHPTTGMMRDARCHIAITPFPPDATDIVQKKIMAGQMMCFFDGKVRNPPSKWRDYCEADHISVRFPDGGTSQRALTGVDKSAIRPPHIAVPNFGAIPPFVKGTDLLATEMDLMKLCSLKELDMAPLPVDADPVQIFMSWHKRNNNEPSHIWLRENIERIARTVQKSFGSQSGSRT